MRTLKVSLGILFLTVLISCTRVAPNYYGVLMENYGKNGKSDYSKQQGRVNTSGMGVELFQVPAWEQRGEFIEDDGKTKKLLHLKAADNTEFNSSPLYSYEVMEDKVIDVVFQNSRLGSGEGFMDALENNVLEPLIYDIIKEESRSYSTDTLMASGGNLRFEQVVQARVTKAFELAGLRLKSFSCNLDFTDKVKEKIDTRNEVNTNISVLDQKIMEQRKQNELAELQTQENLIISRGITPQLLQQRVIDKWDGHLSTYNGNPAFTIPLK